MRVFMPLRGRATARNFPKFLDGLRSTLGAVPGKILLKNIKHFGAAIGKCLPMMTF
jgi:hypothetical protein